MTPTSMAIAAIARADEEDLSDILRAAEERLAALGFHAVAGALKDAGCELRVEIDLQVEVARESAEFNRTWSSADVARKCGILI